MNITRYPRSFQKAIASFKDYKSISGFSLKDLPPAASQPLGMNIKPGKTIKHTTITSKDIVKSGAVWFDAYIAPCWFAGITVKDKEGMVNRAAAAHLTARFQPDQFNKVLSEITPVAPGETLNVFMAGSSQRVSEDWLKKDINNLRSAFDTIGLPLSQDTKVWRQPFLTDINRNIVISDFGNAPEEDLLRIIYFGVTQEDAMLFSLHFSAVPQASRKPLRIKIITSDIGVLEL